MTILDKIIAEKKKEVKELINQTFDQQLDDKEIKPFSERIKEKETMGLIAEIKRASPSKGMINVDVNPKEQAELYEANGASAISVLTDMPFFKGTMDDLRTVRNAVDLPILCKDFIIDPIQIDRAKAAGANIILLIAAALKDEEFMNLFNYAREKELEILCEVNREEEMEKVLNLGANIIGINNRDLKTFDVDLKTTEKLASMVTDPETILISESGIKTKEDAQTVAASGAEAILVGETLMRSDDIAQTMNDLQVLLPNKARA